MIKDNNSDQKDLSERNHDRRKLQKPGPPYVEVKNPPVPNDRRIRPDPRLDKLIEVDWEDDISGSAVPEDQA